MFENHQTHVNIYVNDSKCAPQPAVESALWQLFHPKPVQAVLGAGCSSASMLSQLVLQLFEVPQVCYGATNPALADKEVYPYFLRTIPSDTIQVCVPGMMSLVQVVFLSPRTIHACDHVSLRGRCRFRLA